MGKAITARLSRLLLPLVLLAAPLFIATLTPQEQSTRRTINQSTDRLLTRFRFRSIGPASLGGRIDDIAVSESNPNII